MNLISRTTVGQDLFELWKVPGEWKWVTIGLAGYDGYLRNEHDSVMWARREFNEWVQDALTREIRRHKDDR
jgi:hypothetical protein